MNRGNGLGTGGGCNPIPLAYRDEGDAIVITTDALAAQLPAFRKAATEDVAR